MQAETHVAKPKISFSGTESIIFRLSKLQIFGNFITFKVI